MKDIFKELCELNIKKNRINEVIIKGVIEPWFIEEWDSLTTEEQFLQLHPFVGLPIVSVQFIILN